MDMMTLARTTEFLPGTDHPVRRRRAELTTSEFLQLGLFRVAYLTDVQDDDGTSNIVIHGADGMAIMTVETVERAAEFANELGLGLVAVH
ncbi:MAG TPA: hypothetical protein VMB73_00370 [Acetobacteraceae bacterium]|jgi:hypothetical protein|nr:hypothetical protein [Acetobacteraceae bacterium]